MGRETNIEWCDSTINPTSGCDGCELFQPGHLPKATCYAAHLHVNRLAVAFPDKYASRFEEVRMIPGRMKQAAGWSDLRGTERPGKPWLNGLPRLIFVGDLGDFLSEAVTDAYVLNEIFGAIVSPEGRRHRWLLLTKRPSRLARIAEQLPDGLPENCMAMTTVTNRATAELRVPELLKVRAHWHGLSCEPLRGLVSLYNVKGALCQGWMEQDGGEREPVGFAGIDWVICGGASGRNAAPMHPSWARVLRNECREAEVPFFFKQWGEWIPDPQGPPAKAMAMASDWDGAGMVSAGKGSEGNRLLEGKSYNEMPWKGGDQ